jgi:hypothetical protein
LAAVVSTTKTAPRCAYNCRPRLVPVMLSNPLNDSPTSVIALVVNVATIANP